MLTGIHFLLTYKCTYECDHCFLYSSPSAKGTFTLEQIKAVFDEVALIPTVEWIYFEGGEPFLYYPLLLEGLLMARSRGLKTGVVTNCYWATAEEDAGLWLKPMSAIELNDLSLSDDEFHRGEDSEDSPARSALAAARKLGISVETICVESPAGPKQIESQTARGAPVFGGSVMMRGRAVEKLCEGLPRRSWTEFMECPYEDLGAPRRVHIDPFGHIHICQGISIGNMWERPLSEIMVNYDPQMHPICEPLLRGGPAMLSEQYGTAREDTYFDACHFCYLVRLSLIERFPRYLAPRQVYGLA